MVQKEKSDIVYALADYKQLVVAYKTKYVNMAQQVVFWKTCVIWLGLIVFLIGVAATVGYLDYMNHLSGRQKDISMIEGQAQNLSHQLDAAERQLQQTRYELAQKEAAIKLLEKNVSTTSKKLLEKLLKDQEPGNAR
jgi:Tfp pilus assembly protein PilO